MNGSCENQCNSRNFLTKSEKLEMLQEYQAELQKEVQGVSERIKELKAE